MGHKPGPWYMDLFKQFVLPSFNKSVQKYFCFTNEINSSQGGDQGYSSVKVIRKAFDSG